VRGRTWPVRLVRFSARLVLAAVFLMAAVAKITAPEEFANRVFVHSTLPHFLGELVVAVLPWLELICGLCLALGYAVREAAVLVAGMLLAFLLYTLFAPADQDCGCLIFSTPQPISRGWHLFGDALLLLCCIPVILGRSAPYDARKRENADRPA
jgi:uncharacterized membrane protein YphA (DoxX/SURF4 family)